MELERKLDTAMAQLRKKRPPSALNSSIDGESPRSAGTGRDQRTASSALAIDSENKELKGRVYHWNDSCRHSTENAGLKGRTARDWFMVGAGVVLLGIIAGMVIRAFAGAGSPAGIRSSACLITCSKQP
jgi:SH3 domain protein